MSDGNRNTCLPSLFAYFVEIYKIDVAVNTNKDGIT